MKAFLPLFLFHSFAEHIFIHCLLMIGTKEYSSEQDLVEETYRQLELQYDVKWI